VYCTRNAKAKEYHIKQSFRIAKCEIVAELLNELWFVEHYDLADMLTRKWLEHVYPLRLQGMNMELAEREMMLSLVS
jgi:hypothetical protein